MRVARATRCARSDACGMHRVECMNPAAACPQRLFATGLSRTIADVQACASQAATQACTELLAGARLPCETSPGTRAANQPCAWDSQCASAHCSATNGACGVCGGLVAADQACQSSTECPSGLTCGGLTHTCVSNIVGSRCDYDRCAPQFFCVDPTPGNGTTDGICQLMPKAGDPCVYGGVGALAT